LLNGAESGVFGGAGFQLSSCSSSWSSSWRPRSADRPNRSRSRSSLRAPRLIITISGGSAGREWDDYPTRRCFGDPARFAHDGVARALGLPQDKVHGIWVPGPGSYGRNDAGGAGIDAALLSKAVGRPVRVQGMRYEGHGWDSKGPASIHRARAALDQDGAVIGYLFESKGFSRIDIDTNESDPAYSLAGQLMGLPLKSLQGAEGIGVFIEPGFRRLRPRG
jgi:hypothetical protein